MKSVLITGASTGIGRATALHLDAAGWRVFAGIRKEADAASLREAGSERLTPLWERGQEEVDAIAGRARDGHADLYGKAMESYREVARKTGARGIPPEKVAAKIEHALSARRPRVRYLVGADARGQALVARVLPDRLVDWIVARATGM